MKNLFKVAVAFGVSSFIAASASATTIGSVTVESFADQGSVAAGSIPDFANMLDGQSGSYSLMRSGDTLAFSFSDGAVNNVAGYDIYVFEGFSAPENTQIALTLGGTTLQGTLMDTVWNTSFGGGTVGPRINIYGFDLDDLGVAAGGSVSGDLFLSPASSWPEVFAIGATSTGAAVVPLPATLPILLAGLGGLAVLGRRKQRA